MKSVSITWLFLDGVFVPADEAVCARLSPGKVAGEGVFETMLARGGRIIFLSEHLDRLERGLRVFKIRLPCSRAELVRQLAAALSRNKLKTARVRLMVWRYRGLTHVSIYAAAYRLPSAADFRKGLSAEISKIHCPENSPRANIKSIRYAQFQKALTLAGRRGFGEAIVLNRRGEVMEGSRANIFFVRDGVLYTPLLSCGCLQGITRGQVIDLAKSLEIRVVEGRFKPRDLWGASEVFLTNSLLGIMPVARLGKLSMGTTMPGKWTKKLRAGFSRLVRQELSETFCPGPDNLL